MEFERARTKEQKDVRISEIIEAAVHQYHHVPYSEITLASISKNLSFSRVNLYKYFNSKEEIFLKIVELDMYKWVDKLKLIFAGQPVKDVKSFAFKWASAIYSQRRMAELLSMLYSDLEKHSSVEKLAEFKESYFYLSGELLEILHHQLPMLKKHQLEEFLMVQNTFAMGLYPMCRLSDSQQQAIEMTGHKYHAPDFIETMTQFIVNYVHGLHR